MEDDDVPMLVEAGPTADGLSNLDHDMEDMNIVKVPITIVTGMLYEACTHHFGCLFGC